MTDIKLGGYAIGSIDDLLKELGLSYLPILPNPESTESYEHSIPMPPRHWPKLNGDIPHGPTYDRFTFRKARVRLFSGKEITIWQRVN